MMSEMKIFQKYIMLIWSCYPTLIIIERYVPILGTLISGTFLLAVIGVIFFYGKKRVFIKYGILLYCYYFSKQFYVSSELHREIFIGLITTVAVFDLCRIKVFYEEILLEFREKSTLIEGQLWITLGINIIMIFIPFGYSNVYSDVWSLNAFQGIYVDPHQLAYKITAMIIILLPLILIYNKIRYVILLIGFLGLMVLSGARVPTAFGLIIILYAIKIMDIHFVSKRQIAFGYKEKVSIICMALLMCVAVFFTASHTSFVEKMQVTIKQNDFDSGRAGLVKIDKEYFDTAPRDKQLFGSGTEKTYELHREKAYANIWSHNDFMQLLVGNGLITCIIYSLSMFQMILLVMKKKKIIYILTALGIIFLAWMNGLLIYSRFVYVLPVFVAVQNAWETIRGENR